MTNTEIGSKSGLDVALQLLLIIIVVSLILLVGQVIVEQANIALTTCNLAANCSDCCNMTWG